jgi:excisionase family DNA binding protein
MEHRAPMIFTLRTAAMHTGTSKSTILRAIKSGRLSATRLPDGSYEIDAAELERAYPAERMKQRNADVMEHRAPASDEAAPAATAALEAQVEGLREIIRRADAVADELRQERDRWRSMAEHQQRLIEDQRPRSWWKRLAG